MKVDPAQLRQSFLAASQGHELAELEMASPVFDGKEELPQHRYLILSTPRSGSYWLCRRLWQAGLGLPFEYLNRLHLQRFARRWNLPDPNLDQRRGWGRLKANLRQWSSLRPSAIRSSNVDSLEAYLEGVQQRRSLSGWFGLKVQPVHLEELKIDVEQRFSSWMLLPLLRKDQRRQLASYLFSRVSGAYDLGVITSTRGESLNRLIDPILQERIANLLAAQNKFILQTAKSRTLQPLWLEDLLLCSPEDLKRTLIPYLPVLAKDDKILQSIQRRSDPLHRIKQELLQDLSDSLPESLVDRLEQSIA